MSKHPLLHGARGERHVLLGNEAIVRGALEAGVNMVTCYPGTPSSEVPDTFYKLGGEGRYKIEYAVNEKVAFEVAAGAALGGAQALVTMKHVGLNVAADPLFTSVYTGLPGGLVVLSADDPGCHSSQNEQDNRYYARFASLPCLPMWPKPDLAGRNSVSFGQSKAKSFTKTFAKPLTFALFSPIL